MADSWAGAGKEQNEFGSPIESEGRECSNYDRFVSKGHRTQMERAPLAKSEITKHLNKCKYVFLGGKRELMLQIEFRLLMS